MRNIQVLFFALGLVMVGCTGDEPGGSTMVETGEASGQSTSPRDRDQDSRDQDDKDCDDRDYDDQDDQYNRNGGHDDDQDDRDDDQDQDGRDDDCDDRDDDKDEHDQDGNDQDEHDQDDYDNDQCEDIDDECDLYCPWGYETDDDGCEVCECEGKKPHNQN